jgi:hypothetical protein
LNAWKGRESPLLPQERSEYLNGMQDAIAGFDDARHALAVAAERLEREGR